MPTHDIIDNRNEKLVDHINRILGEGFGVRLGILRFGVILKKLAFQTEYRRAHSVIKKTSLLESLGQAIEISRRRKGGGCQLFLDPHGKLYSS